MAEQANDEYAALERLYSERRWAEVEASAAVLLAEVDGDLRCRVLLLLGHTRLYGFNDAGVAAEHYRRVLAAEPEALLLGIAQEGLNQCLAAEEPAPADEPSPADAMPWLEQVAVAEVTASGAGPAKEAAQEPPQNFPGFTKPAETFESLAINEGPTEIAKAPDQPTHPTQPTQLSPKESAELAKGLLGVVIRPN
ncbi:MAG: hypothetical protein NTW02_06240 [Cyanobium sp. LacPavin_0920_WC12_MAG_62_9]|nr:hypothetical protein [Cyanobium sp. LacPavin_0920_WC12_MAG_62_9]